MNHMCDLCCTPVKHPMPCLSHKTQCYNRNRFQNAAAFEKPRDRPGSLLPRVSLITDTITLIESTAALMTANVSEPLPPRRARLVKHQVD